LTPISDYQLIENIRVGDQSSFEKLYKKYYTLLCLYASSRIGGAEDAKELVQDVFFSIWKNRQSINITESVKSYLYRAVHNQGVNFLKRKGRERSYLHTLSPEPISQNEEAELELKQKINDAINGLPPKRQEIFKLNRFEGLKYREIADHLGISVKTVENQMGSALRYLHQQLGEFMAALWILFIW